MLSLQDVDIYKTTVRDDIDSWLKVLQRHGIDDWLIVQVETHDTKRSNKLLARTTVYDKIKSDFASKHPDRYADLILLAFRNLPWWKIIIICCYLIAAYLCLTQSEENQSLLKLGGVCCFDYEYYSFKHMIQL